MLRILPLLMAVAAGGQAGSDAKPEMTRQEAEALAASLKCEKVKAETMPCMRWACADEADALLFRDSKTLVKELARRWAVELPRGAAAKGIRMPRGAPPAEGCPETLGSSEKETCIRALLFSDLSRWLNREPSMFGECVQAALKRYQQYRSEASFQRTRWGMTSAEVAKLHPGLTAGRTGERLGRMVVADLPARVLFRFVDDRLWATEVFFDVDSAMPERDVRNTADLRKLLTSRYGEPETHDGSPSGEDLQFDELYRAIGGTGRAVRGGTLLMRATWSLADTSVELILGAPEGEYEHRLVYTSKVLAGRAEVLRDARRASEL